MVFFVKLEEHAEQAKKAEPQQATVQMTSEVHQRHQRPSLIEFFVGSELGRHGSKIVNDHNQQSQAKGRRKLKKLALFFCLFLKAIKKMN